MLTADAIRINDPLHYIRCQLEKFTEILEMFEEYKAGLTPDGLESFKKLEDKLLENYFSKAFDPEADRALGERKAVLKNEDEQMMEHALQLRAFV